MSNGNNAGSTGKDFFADVLDETPVSYEITYNGKRKVCHFRRISAGDRVKLTKGQRMTIGKDGANSMEMDLADTIVKNQMLVQFSCVKDDGSKVFRNLEQVQELEAALFDELLKGAQHVNQEDTNEGKSSSKTPSSAAT